MRKCFVSFNSVTELGKYSNHVCRLSVVVGYSEKDITALIGRAHVS